MTQPRAALDVQQILAQQRRGPRRFCAGGGSCPYEGAAVHQVSCTARIRTSVRTRAGGGSGRSTGCGYPRCSAAQWAGGYRRWRWSW